MQPLSSEPTEAPLATVSLDSVGGYTTGPHCPLSDLFLEHPSGTAMEEPRVLTTCGLYHGGGWCRCRGLFSPRERHGFPGARELIGGPL